MMTGSTSTSRMLCLHFLLVCCIHNSNSFQIGVTTTDRPAKGKLFAITPKGNPDAAAAAATTATTETASTTNKPKDAFLKDFFGNVGSSGSLIGTTGSTDCDDTNTPPSLRIILRSFSQLASGSDIRGRFVDHHRSGTIASVAHAIRRQQQQDGMSGIPALTPLAAHCLGYAFATMVREQHQQQQQQQDRFNNQITTTDSHTIRICLGQDPRSHGSRLADAFARGAQSAVVEMGAAETMDGDDTIEVVYTGIATTPSVFEFCRSDLADAGVMVTASHLPSDRNGFKFFTKQGGFSKDDVQTLISIAKQHMQSWQTVGVLPSTSGTGAVFCSEWVDFMPHYASTLSRAILSEVGISEDPLPLTGLRIVLNAGNGAGGFFHQVLSDLGADVSCSAHITPDADFPVGVPNPEYPEMIKETTRLCQLCAADLGIMLDTDADRCGFIVPKTSPDDSRSDTVEYEPLNRNRLIALLGVIFAKSSPGCTFVTDSVTSEGLATFLQDDLGLKHVRYLKGYANVIEKARELTESGVADAQVAVETSGHCAMQENGYLDDGTYTAVKVIGLLARTQTAHRYDNSGNTAGSSSPSSSSPAPSLLSLIENLKEMTEVSELRMSILDGTLESTAVAFDHIAFEVEQACARNDLWELDTENLEGIRVRTGNGGFFMLRKSLHDPLISIQIEGESTDEVRRIVIEPLLKVLNSDTRLQQVLDMDVMRQY